MLSPLGFPKTQQPLILPFSLRLADALFILTGDVAATALK
jgi:hypothetical protein